MRRIVAPGDLRPEEGRVNIAPRLISGARLTLRGDEHGSSDGRSGHPEPHQADHRARRRARPERIGDEASLRDDLKLDSLSLLEIGVDVDLRLQARVCPTSATRRSTASPAWSSWSSERLERDGRRAGAGGLHEAPDRRDRPRRGHAGRHGARRRSGTGSSRGAAASRPSSRSTPAGSPSTSGPRSAASIPRPGSRTLDPAALGGPRSSPSPRRAWPWRTPGSIGRGARAGAGRGRRWAPPPASRAEVERFDDRFLAGELDRSGRSSSASTPAT